MKTENYINIIRALGIIEGISFAVDSNVQDAITYAVEMIENALANEEKE